MTDIDNKVLIEKVEESLAKRASSGVSSVSVDGMSTSFQSLDSQVKALSALKKAEASKNPLGALKIFKIKSQG